LIAVALSTVTAAAVSIWMVVAPGREEPAIDPSSSNLPSATSTLPAETKSKPPSPATPSTDSDLTRALDEVLPDDWEIVFRNYPDQGRSSTDDDVHAAVVGNYWAVADYCALKTTMSLDACHEAARVYLEKRLGNEFGPVSERDYPGPEPSPRSFYAGYDLAGYYLRLEPATSRILGDRPGFSTLASEAESSYPGSPITRGESDATENGPVAIIQQALRERGFGEVTPTGVFDVKTKQAVRSWQADLGLEVDGVVGPMTWAALVD